MKAVIVSGVFLQLVFLVGVLGQTAITPAQLPQQSGNNPAADPDGCDQGSLNTHVQSIASNLPLSLSSGGGALDSLNAVLRGRNMSNPANSCNEIYTIAPSNSPSGNYWLRNQNGESISVYCDMDITCGCSSDVGWRRVSTLNMSDPNTNCPSGWQLRQAQGQRACGKTTNGFGFNARKFDIDQVPYQKVCGKIIGYLYGSPDGFNRWGSQQWRTVQNVYFDGIDVVRGTFDESTATIDYSHIWSNAAAYSDVSNFCPCATSSNRPVPTFVGSNYYCEGGVSYNGWSATLKPADPLWDGMTCTSVEGPCCAGAPQFCRNLNTATNEDLYMRLMSDGNFNDEDVPVHYYELYVQ